MERTELKRPVPGDRVGAFVSVVDGVALFLGYGTYVGNDIPPFSGLTSQAAALEGLRASNPKIVLDDGEVVWGCQCWWGSEADVKAELLTMTKVVPVTIADIKEGRLPNPETGEYDGKPVKSAMPQGFFEPPPKPPSGGFWS